MENTQTPILATGLGPVDFAVTDSSNITRIQYNDNLIVTFKNGSTYVYESVPIDRIEAFLNDPSKGGFLRKEIIPFFVAKKLLLEEKKENVND